MLCVRRLWGAVVQSERLSTIINMVPRTETVADIGCDHGKVAAALIKTGIAQKVICTDISGKSLDKARTLAVENNISNQVICREGDGFTVVGAGEANVAVIAGMGGELIASILESGFNSVPDTLVLSCNTAAEILRTWLSKNGYRIDDENMVYESRHYYPIIRAVKGKVDTLSDIQLELGPILLHKKDPTLKRFVQYRTKITKEIRAKIDKADAGDRQDLLSDIDHKLKEYKEVERCL